MPKAKKATTKKKKTDKNEKPRSRQPKDVGVLAIASGGRRGGRLVGRSHKAFSEAKAKRRAKNPDPPLSFLPKGPIKIKRTKSDLTGL